MSAGSPLAPLRAEVMRKALHLATAALPIAWWAGVVSDEAVRGLVGALAATALIAEAMRARFPVVQRAVERMVGGLLRAHERRGLTGATWLALSMCAVALILPQRAAICALWAVAVGDALAALVGRAFAARGPSPTGKTFVGSFTCAATSAAGAWWLAAASPLVAALIGVASALAERPRLAIDDNVRVAAAAGIAAWVLGLA